jgi:hypothetical protein
VIGRDAAGNIMTGDRTLSIDSSVSLKTRCPGGAFDDAWKSRGSIFPATMQYARLYYRTMSLDIWNSGMVPPGDRE